MSSPSREHLLGFLLGALSPDEHEQVEAEIERNPMLRAEMQQLNAYVQNFGLADERPTWDPPAGLAERTCRYVAEAARGASLPSGRLAGRDIERERRFTWSDFVTIAAVVVAAASLFFPALSFSRSASQIATCQNQLRQIGFGMQEYSDLQPDHSFPGPEAEGPRAAAGIVAPLLVSQNLANSQMFVCPGPPRSGDAGNFRVPMVKELDRAAGKQLVAMQRMMGGDYGFNMGYVDGGRLVRAANSRRGQYVLAGDAPSNSRPRRASANHADRGQNVLFEDGHVHFLRQLPLDPMLDDPFHNRDGYVAAGVDRDDAVLGASEDSPIPVSLISDR
jgi:hypothetical protein